MDTEERLAEIERRLAELETTTDFLSQRAAIRQAPPQPPPRRPEGQPAAMAGRPAPMAASDAPGKIRTPMASSPSTIPARDSGTRSFLSTEEWIGQRGLLAIGVLLILLAVGYLLKLAFDSGWIPPAARCTAGVVVGLGVAAVGWRLDERRGLRTYGSALIGCGFGIIYLSLWATTRLYDLVPPGIVIASLALVSLSLAAVAYLLDVEALGATAALGAFFGPIVIATEGNPNGFLIYLALVGATLGGASAAKRWRYATLLVAASVFGLGMTAGASQAAEPGRVLLYGLLAGSAGLYLGLRERWPETRFLAFSGGWSLLGFAALRLNPPWPVTIAGMVLAAPVWRHALTTTRVWPDSRGNPEGTSVKWSTGETGYFYLTPILLAWATWRLAPAWFGTHPAAVALLLSLAYLITGFALPLPPFAVVGTTAAAIAVILQWESFSRVWVLLGLAFLWHALDYRLHRPDGGSYARVTLIVALIFLGDARPPDTLAAWLLLVVALAWAALDHLLDRRDGRVNSLLTLAATVVYLCFIWLAAREPAGPAFVDAWAWSLWATVAATAVLAAGLWRRGVDPGTKTAEATNTELAQQGPSALWTAAGLLLFLGVTGELIRYFGQSGLPRDTADLASGLSVSAWWAVFAAGLVVWGFSRVLQSVRTAGLAVAGLAVAKVLLFDLSRLEAFYRVASVFILGVVSLALAYLYHRQAHGRAKT